MTNNVSDKVREVYLPLGLVITVLAMAIAGGVAWGQLKQHNEDQDRRVQTIEQRQSSIANIEADQAAIKKDVDAIRREQKIYIDGLKDDIKDLKKLLEQR